MKAKRFFVSGKVQGVFFRATTKKKARSLGLKGFVKNLSDGRVEAYAEGDEESLNQLHEMLKKGPRAARVDGVEVQSEEPSGDYEDFEITY